VGQPDYEGTGGDGMSPATVLLIINIINGLINVGKDAPTVMEEARSLVAKIQPHIATMNDEVRRQFTDTLARMS